MADQSKIGTPFKGKGWRVDYGDPAPSKTTAADIVRYERDELGNEMKVSPKDLKSLEDFSHDDVVWVTKSKRDAKIYLSEGDTGEESLAEVELGNNPRLICADEFGGYLVLRHLPRCDTVGGK